MVNYIFENILGSFVFDEKFNLVEKADSKSKLKNKEFEEVAEKDMGKILAHLKRQDYFQQFFKKNLAITKKQIKESVTDSMLLIQAIKTIDEIDTIANALSKRLREWYELHNPEFSRTIGEHKTFAELILKKNKFELLKQLDIKPKDSLGADLSDEDLEPVKEIAKKVHGLYVERESLEKYLEKIMERHCPNVKAITGVLIGAKLVEQAGSLKKLALFPASTIQVLGAEKALFRHLKTGARCPKYGILHEHALVMWSKQANKGKVARYIADKISIASKVDHYKGEFIGDKLRKELEEKVKCLQ